MFLRCADPPYQVLYSLTGTCKHHGIDPFAYLQDILSRLPSHPADQLDELLPDVASNDELVTAEEIPKARPPVPPPSTRWLAAAITLAVIVAVLAAVSLWHAPADAGRQPRVMPQPGLVVMPVARVDLL